MEFDTPIEFAASWLSRIEDFERGCLTVPSRVVAQMTERIFENGLDSSLNTIGNYSTKKAYVKSPNKRESKTYEGGYAEFKKKRSKSKAAQSGNVDVTLKGETRRVFSSSLVSLGDCKFELVLDGAAGRKMGYVSSRFNKDIVSFSDEDKELYKKLSIENIERLLR